MYHNINDDRLIEVNPGNVYIHIRVGNSYGKTNDIVNNISNHEYYASNSNIKMYKLLADQLIYPNVKVYDMCDEFGSLCPDSLKDRIKKIKDPRFSTNSYQVYGTNMENMMYRGLVKL